MIDPTKSNQTQTPSPLPVSSELMDIPPQPPNDNSHLPTLQPRSDNTPPSVTSTIVSPPLKKKKKGKIVATILGVLLVVGGVGVGVALVRQNQDIRERAWTQNSCESQDAVLCPSPCYDATYEAGRRNAKGELEECYCKRNNESCSISSSTVPVPTSSTASQCSRITDTRKATGDALTIESSDINKCKAACPDGTIWVAKYKCNGINLSQGCQDNGVVLSWDAKAGESFPIGSLDCGTIQIDAGCKNQANTYGSVAFLSKSANIPCKTPAPTQPPKEESAQCLSIKVYDTNWNLVPQSQLSQLRPGDKVRFTVIGSPADKIDKARFTINGQLGQEVTTKKPGTDEFYTEYTIPSGATTFSVKAEVHHITLGWF